MISYTKRYVNIVSLTVTILLYIFLIKVNLLPQINDFEKADIIKARTGRDITKSILLERENKVD